MSELAPFSPIAQPGALTRASLGQPCADRMQSLCHALGVGAPEQSNGVKLGETSRIRAPLLRDCGDLRVVLGNWGKVNEAGNWNLITVKVGLEMPNGEVLPVNFGGRESAGIEKGRYVASDVLGADGGAGEAIWIRTYVSVAAEGLKWPLSLTLNKAIGEGVTTGNTDKSQGSSEVPPSEGTCYSPVLLLASSPARPVAVVGFHGDSIIAGNADAVIDNGWARRALVPRGIAYVDCSKGGGKIETSSQYVASEGRMQLAGFASCAIEAYGVNDFLAGRTFAQIRSDKERLWHRLLERGQKVFATTVTPVATSTDGFTTTKNQTTNANNVARAQLNEWLRGGPSELSGLIDTAAAVEFNVGSGLWVPLMTGEGIHPLPAGHEAMALKVNAAAFSV